MPAKPVRGDGGRAGPVPGQVFADGVDLVLELVGCAAGTGPRSAGARRRSGLALSQEALDERDDPAAGPP